jgi:hypothetical protein
LITVPGRVTNEGTPLVANVTQERNDAAVSRSVGALYKLSSGVSPFVGAAKSFLSNFLSENTQDGIGARESALQYAAGVKRIFRWCLAILNRRCERERAAAAGVRLQACGLLPPTRPWPIALVSSQKARPQR